LTLFYKVSSDSFGLIWFLIHHCCHCRHCRHCRHCLHCRHCRHCRQMTLNINFIGKNLLFVFLLSKKLYNNIHTTSYHSSGPPLKIITKHIIIFFVQICISRTFFLCYLCQRIIYLLFPRKMFLPVCSKKIKTSTTNKKEKTNQQIFRLNTFCQL
jgi:hypothetical protein